VEAVTYQLERFGLKAQELPKPVGDATAGIDAWNKSVKARADLGIDTAKVLEDEGTIIDELTDQL
jgi:hypothetical protein